jgi:hypothetical protein
MARFVNLKSLPALAVVAFQRGVAVFGTNFKSFSNLKKTNVR